MGLRSALDTELTMRTQGRSTIRTIKLVRTTTTDHAIDMQDAETRDAVNTLVDGEHDLLQYADLDVYTKFLI